MKCPICRTPMKPLLVSLYCPNEDLHARYTQSSTVRTGLCATVNGQPKGHGKWRYEVFSENLAEKGP